MKRCIVALASVVALALLTDVLTAQPPRRGERPQGRRPGGPGGPEGRGPGRGGFRPPALPLMVALDTDRDGELSAEEIKNASQSLKKLDKDDDGKLSREEMRPQFRGGPGGPGGQGRGGPGGQGRGGPGGQGRGGPGGQGPGSMVERIMGFDKDGNGKVTKDELPEPMQKFLLDRADANKDGAIDRDEAEKMAAERAGRGGGPPRGDRGGRPGADRPRGGPGGDRPRRPQRPGGEN